MSPGAAADWFGNAFGINLLYKHETRQVTLHAAITGSTPTALGRIIQLVSWIFDPPQKSPE